MQKIILFFLLISSVLQAQIDSISVDNKYLEDQLYIDITYIKLLNLPNQITHTGFSYGFGLGFIKDIPVNKRRNFGFGAGLGYGFQSYYFNVKEDTNTPIENEEILRSNKVTTHTIEIPIEFRFRTSTSEKYTFWRIYSGFKMGYTFATNTRLKQREDFDVKDVIEVNDFTYGLTFSAGYGKWNFHAYYGLNDVFSNTLNNSYNINVSDLRLGLIFYVL